MGKSATELLDDVCGADERGIQRARLRLGDLTIKDAWMHQDLLTALDSEDDRRRFWAITGLSGLARYEVFGSEAARTASRLVLVAAADPKFGIRQSALSVLGRMPAHVDLTLSAITRSLRIDASEFVRADAARALARLGEGARSVAGALLSALDDENDAVRWAASIALKFVPIAPNTDVARALREAATNHPEASIRAQLEVAVGLLDVNGQPV